MTPPTSQPPVGVAPRPYGLGKRLKTASISALVTSLLWIVFMVLYWPRANERMTADLRDTAATTGAAAAATVARADEPVLYEGPAYVPPPGGLRLPVQGVTSSELTDTYSQSRSNGARAHNAIDIMAPRGTPVIAAAAGTVEKLFFSNNGGTTLYERSPDGKSVYYYAHLDGYASGITEGIALAPGQTLGFVGSSGDADPGAPHLHFAIQVLAAGERWWQGRPINPYPLLRGH